MIRADGSTIKLDQSGEAFADWIAARGSKSQLEYKIMQHFAGEVHSEFDKILRAYVEGFTR